MKNPLIPRILLIHCCIFIHIFLFSQVAEDIWGNKIDIAHNISSGKPLVIVPFSTSNCGYCMIDGYFTEMNYIRANDLNGGYSYHQCLFNPQLDVVAFSKHFGWTGQVLTYPPALHKYHEDGFPTLLAFKDGKQVLQYYYNYAKYDTLKLLLWDEKTSMIPTGEMHMATRFIYENENYEAVCVFPDKYSVLEDDITEGNKYKAYTCKNIGQLVPEDKKKHLYFKGRFTTDEMAALFRNTTIPFTFKGQSIFLGDYGFNPDSTGIKACFPNPFNREKYILFNWGNPFSDSFWQNNHLDFILYTGKGEKEAKRLLYGHFSKNDESLWSFSEDNTFSDVDKKAICTGKCMIPQKKNYKQNIPYEIISDHTETQYGTCTTLGTRPCRFPGLDVTDEGKCMTSWEEEGNILLACIDSIGSIQTWFVENDESESYNSLVAVTGKTTWIFYLNKRDGYYRLYGKSFDGLRFSDEILLSAKEPFDVVTPAVAVSMSGDITLAWCEWKANCRFLKYRQITNNTLCGILEIKPAPSRYISNYTNAWYPSIGYDHNDFLWGAWNQHYPANFGVFGGKLSDTAVSITQSAEKMDDWENGGYPSLFTGIKNEKIVVYESGAWDVYWNANEQSIKLSQYDDKTEQWSLGQKITISGMTQLNQTPTGLTTRSGKKIVAWSGRTLDENSTWGIYLCSEENGIWSMPQLISDQAEHARYPRISTRNGHTWISWHCGSGNGMRVKVLNLEI